MENASKALTIAGAILISLMVISAFVFMYRDLTEAKRQESENQKIEQVAEFNKSFEAYNKELYGAELMSLANKIEDYNEKYTKRMKEGYGEIELIIDDKSSSVEFTEIRDKVEGNQQKSITGIMNIYKSGNYLEGLKEANDTLKTKNTDTAEHKRAEYQIEQILKKIGESSVPSTLDNDYQTYLKYKELKNQKYKCEEITYYSNGRIKTMKFKKQ